MKMFTDPNRISAKTPGRVEGNPVFIYLDAFNLDIEMVNDLKQRYKLGQVGDVEVKLKLANAINQMLNPIRQRRFEFEKNPSKINEILKRGSQKMKIEAQETIQLVREAMGITYKDYMEVKNLNQIQLSRSIPV